MRFPVAAATAFCVGYALGSREVRKRSIQVVRRVGGSATVSLCGGKAKAVAVLAVERARDTIGVRLGWRDGDEATDALVIEMVGDLASAFNSRHRIPA